MAHRSDAETRDAFTLIELVVVITIIALLATLAVLSSGGIIDRYQLRRAADAIEMFDARARRQSSSLRQPVDAVIQPGQRRLLIHTSVGVGKRSPANEYRLPRGVEIPELRLRRRVAAGGNLEIHYNRLGSCPTYAVRLQRGKMSRWLVVLGVSGQIVPLQDESDVDELLSL